MAEAEGSQQQLDRSRHAWAMALAGLSALMLLWVPVGRRLTTGRRRRIDDAQRGELADVVEATSGVLLWVMVPLLLVMVVNLDLGHLTRDSKQTRSTQWRDD